MLKENHASILHSGVEAWNQWRQDHKDVLPNLDCAVLRGQDLSKADLHQANLNEADLREADLSDSSLAHARLTGADLRRTNLTRANLKEANLNRANLRSASLVWSNLRLCTFTGADLREANLENAELGGTVLADTDLSNAHGLHLCNHWGPVSIDHRTLIKSGHLPVTFLRGCGLAEDFIEQLPSLFQDPLQLCAVFISSSIADKDFAHLLHADLQAAGARCWFAPPALVADAQVSESLPLHETLLVPVVSKNWLVESFSPLLSKAFQEERLHNRTIVVPVRLDSMTVSDSSFAELVRSRESVDFLRWRDPKSYKAALKTLVTRLRAAAGNEKHKDSSE